MVAVGGFGVAVAIFGLVVIVMSLFQSEKNEQVEKRAVWAAVVPHHDVVKSERLRFWDNYLATVPELGDVERLIIIGPNHFGSDQTVIVYDDEDYTTFGGVFQNFMARAEYFDQGVVKNTTLVKEDHAVTSLLAELYERFPSAEIAAFLVGDEVSLERTAVLNRFVEDSCRKCLVVASVDFSHYLEAAEAEQKTSEAIRQLEEMTVREGSLGVPDHADCPACLFAVQETARAEGRKFELFFRDNYGVERERTTHVIGIYK